MLQSSETIWYDPQGIVPGYQDSMGSPKGMRPNTISGHLIAIPDGHQRLFQKKGTFRFPFGTGGVDDSTNVRHFNFWAVPRQNGKVLPVVYWITEFSHWHWIFPVGTTLGEVLVEKFPDGSEAVFEIRTRTRRLDGWSNDIFRPFKSATELAAAIKSKRANWRETDSLKALVAHLQNPDTLTPHILESKAYPQSFATLNGYLDTLPSFGDQALAKELLQTTTFVSVKGAVWKQSGDKVAYAPNTKDSFGITANNYVAGMFEVSDKFCSRCHEEAGRSIRDHHMDLAAYGEMWGEDQTFSWHLFETASFVKPNGDVKCFNQDFNAGCLVDDNRTLRKSFVEAGLVVKYDPKQHTDEQYKQLARPYVYRPF